MNRNAWCQVLVLAGLLSAASNSHGQGRNIPRTPAPPDHATVHADQSVLIDVLANDGVLGPDLEITHVGRPAVGSMVMEGDAIRYTPPAGASGFRDRGGYLVRSSNGNAAMGVVTVDVLAGTQAVHLHGQVPGVEPTCSLRAIVGDAVFNGCVDTQGRYEITVGDVPLDAVVQLRLDARVPGGSLSSRWMSLPGSFAQLKEAAGSDSTLDETQYPLLSITPFTTVQSALIASMNGDEVPAHAERLADLRQVAEAVHIYRHGGLVHAILHGDVALPAGYLDAFELVSDVYAASELDGANSAKVNAALESLLDEARNVAPYPSGLTGGFVSSAGGSPTAWAVGRGSSYQFEFRQGGQGRYLSEVDSRSDALWWTLDGRGGIDVFGTEPELMVSYPFFVCDEPFPPYPIQVEVHYSTELEGLTRILSAPEGDVVLLRRWRQVTNRDTFPEDCPVPSTVEDRYVRDVVQLLPRNPELDFVSTAGIGEVGVVVRPAADPASNTSATPQREGGVLDFDGMIADIPGFEPSFAAMALPDGRLRVDLQGSPESGGELATIFIRRARASRSGAEWWALEYLGGSGAHATESTLAVPVGDVGDVLLPGGLVGLWEHGFYVSSQGSAVQPLGDSFYWDVRAEAPDTMVQVNVIANQPSPGFNYLLTREDGVIRATTFRQDGESVPECTDTGPTCFGLQRFWRPLSMESVDGQRRLYVFETLWTWDDVERDWDPVSQRMNFIEERDTLPGVRTHAPPSRGISINHQ